MDGLRKMEYIYIEAGDSDEFGLDIGARVMSRKLKSLGVGHETKEFSGGHFGINHRYEDALKAISANLPEDLG